MFATLVQGIFFIYGFYSWQKYFLDLLGQDLVWVTGVIAACVGVTQILGNALVGRITKRVADRGLILMVAVGVSTVAIVGAALVQQFWVAVPLYLVSTTAFGVYMPVKQGWLNARIPSEERATIISLDALFGDGGMTVGQIGLGYLSQVVSIPVAWLVGGLTQAAALPLLAGARRAERAEPAEPAARPDARRTRPDSCAAATVVCVEAHALWKALGTSVRSLERHEHLRYCHHRRRAGRCWRPPCTPACAASAPSSTRPRPSVASSSTCIRPSPSATSRPSRRCRHASSPCAWRGRPSSSAPSCASGAPSRTSRRATECSGCGARCVRTKPGPWCWLSASDGSRRDGSASTTRSAISAGAWRTDCRRSRRCARSAPSSIGGGDTALDTALSLREVADVTVIRRRDEFRAYAHTQDRFADAGIEVVSNGEVVGLRGRERLESVIVGVPTSPCVELPADLVLVSIGQVPDLSGVSHWGLGLTGTKIDVDSAMQTDIPGVYAVGDFAAYPGKVRMIATAVAEGSTAAASAQRYLAAA